MKTDLILIYPGEVKKNFSIHKREKRKIVALFVLKEKEKAKIYILIQHLEASSSSKVMIKGILFNEATISIRGKIIAESEAKKINAYLKEKVLLLGKKGSARLEPQLEIKNNNLQVAHAAAVGPVDQEEIFYLQSRGIKREIAKKLVARSFLEKTIRQINSKTVQKRVKNYLKERLDD
jgi:Fe-S cluster assembly protein SufD